VKNLYREKLVNVITDFHNEQPTKGERLKSIVEKDPAKLSPF
jgi:hypothetical protein